MAIFTKRGNYYIDYYADGQRFREKVGPSLRLARQVEIKRKAEIAEGKFFPERSKPTISFPDMVDLYWELHAKQKPGARFTGSILKRLRPVFGQKNLDQVTIPDVLRYLNDVKEQSSAATANRYHNVIRAIFNRAIEWEKFSGKNPAAKVKQFRTDNARTRFLEKEEIALLLAACDPEIYAAVVCALMTGMRQAEVLGLRWENVDLANGIIYVLQTKSGKPREIPIASKLAAVLKATRKGDGGPIFPITARSLHRHFVKALRVAGINDFRWHDLRHTFASHYIMRTNDLPATQNMLGHQSPRMTQRYAHLSQGYLKVGMQLFDSGMDTIWTPEPPADLVPPNKNDSLTAAVVEETTREIWSGRAESNRRLILGKDPFYH